MTVEYIANDKETINRFMDIFDASSEGLWEMTSDNNVNFYNSYFYKKFELSLDRSNLDEWTVLIHPDDLEYFSDNVNQQVSEGLERFKSQYRVKTKLGSYIWIEATGVSRFDEDGRFLYMVGSHKDITEEKDNENCIYKAAYIDETTGLLNRRKLVENLKQTIVNRTNGALIYVNLNNFRYYTNYFGYNSGNEVIIIVSKALKSVFKKDCSIYRIYKDEFIVLIENKTSELVITFYIKLLFKLVKQSIGSLHETYTQAMSVGVCMLPSKENNEESLIYQAKLTMLYAKEHLAKGYAFLDKRNQNSIKKKLHIETGMKTAIREREFFLKYQPIISATTNRLESFEALLRWQSKEYGEIMPDEFIPVAEKNQDIIVLGYFVLVEACSFISRYNTIHNENIKISVNVSVLQLLQKTFVSRAVKIASNYNVNPNNIVIEVTESLLLDSNMFAVKQIGMLKDSGFVVSLDDFGTGYSSLNSFFTIPFTQIKIDKSVISQAVNSWEASTYITFLTSLCSGKNIEVVAEGIENKEMEEMTKEMGVDLLQGYHFSQPLSEIDAYKTQYHHLASVLS